MWKSCPADAADVLLLPAAAHEQMYERTGTGLAPEIVHFKTADSGSDGDGEDMIIKA